MKIFVVVSTAVILMSGCASSEKMAKLQALESVAETRFNASRANSAVSCINKMQCDKAFSLAKIYVQKNSDMKIQSSDDTMISSYNPTRVSYIGLSATRVPGAGDSGSIELQASCKGIEFYRTGCLDRLSSVYEGFKPYIESKLQ